MMNRRTVLSTMAALGAGATATIFLQPVDDRISDLETTVEALDERVTRLESVDAAKPSTEEDAEASAGNEDDWISVTGTGTSVSDKFNLTAGRYRVHGEVDAGGDISGFIVLVFDPSGNEEYLFNELIQDQVLWEGQAVYEASEDGDYYVETSNITAAWSLAFEPY